MFTQSSFVFLDETGSDRRDSLRRYGYGLRGKPVNCQKLLVRGERVSAIAAMTVSGVLDVKIVRGSVKGDTFIDFIDTNLLPHLNAFNGSNPNSVVVLDNCSVHHVAGAVQGMQQKGSLVQFLPPYSPDLNPIEILFSKVKSILRAMETELSVTNDIETMVLMAFSQITRDNCREWVENIGLYNNQL